MVFVVCVENICSLVMLISLHALLKKKCTLPAEKDSDLPAEMSLKSDSKPLKDKTTKAERRALQEAQRAAKASGKGLTGLSLT